MRISLTRRGLHCLFRMGDLDGKRPIGFKIKPVSAMLFSERNGHRRGVRVGPLYFGLYS